MQFRRDSESLERSGYFGDIGIGGGDWIHEAQDRDPVAAIENNPQDVQ
jgi:hypothetical protein